MLPALDSALVWSTDGRGTGGKGDLGRGLGPPSARGAPTPRFGDGFGAAETRLVELPCVGVSGGVGCGVGWGLGPFTVADDRLVVELDGVGTVGSARPSRLGRSSVSRLGRSKLARSKDVRGLTSGYRSDMRRRSVDPFSECRDSCSERIRFVSNGVKLRTSGRAIDESSADGSSSASCDDIVLGVMYAGSGISGNGSGSDLGVLGAGDGGTGDGAAGDGDGGTGEGGTGDGGTGEARGVFDACWPQGRAELTELGVFAAADDRLNMSGRGGTGGGGEARRDPERREERCTEERATDGWSEERWTDG